MRAYANKYKSIVIKQLYLQKYGVSFDYTDKKSSRELDNLVVIVKDTMETDD